MGMINFAHGELMMWGMFAAWAMAHFFRLDPIVTFMPIGLAGYRVGAALGAFSGVIVANFFAIFPQVDTIMDALAMLHREQRMTLLLVEQNVPAALDLCQRAYVLQRGRVVAEGASAGLLGSELIRRSYLGI